MECCALRKCRTSPYSLKCLQVQRHSYTYTTSCPSQVAQLKRLYLLIHILSLFSLTSDENTHSRKCDRDTEYVSVEIKVEFFSDSIIAFSHSSQGRPWSCLKVSWNMPFKPCCSQNKAQKSSTWPSEAQHAPAPVCLSGLTFSILLSLRFQHPHLLLVPWKYLSGLSLH